MLTGVYAASEAAVPGVDARTIGAPLEALGVDVAYVDGVGELPQYLYDSVPDGALVLILGAGTVTGAAHRLGHLVNGTALEARAVNAEQLERSLLDDADRAELAGLLGERAAFGAPLAPLCSWKIGGPADALVYLESAAELAAVLRLVFRRKAAVVRPRQRIEPARRRRRRARDRRAAGRRRSRRSRSTTRKAWWSCAPVRPRRSRC